MYINIYSEYYILAVSSAKLHQVMPENNNHIILFIYFLKS